MNNATQIAQQIEDIWMAEWQAKLGPDEPLNEFNQARLHGLRMELEALQARCDKLEAAARDALQFVEVIEKGGRDEGDEYAATTIAKALRSVVDGGE